MEQKGDEGAGIHMNALDEAKWLIRILEPHGVGIREGVQSYLEFQHDIYRAKNNSFVR